jgi:hypothetical protein
MLTTGGDEGKRPESWPAAELGWPARPSRGGGGLMHLRRWGAAERVCLGERMLLVASICSVGAPSHRIGDGPHRPAAALGWPAVALLCAAAAGARKS